MGKENSGVGGDSQISGEYEGCGNDGQDQQSNYDPSLFKIDETTKELTRISGRRDKKLSKFPVDATPTRKKQ